MQIKLTWSYSSTPSAQAPTSFIIQHKLSSAGSYTTQTTVTNIGTICTGGSCTYTYPAGVLDNNKSYDFRVGTNCSEGTISYSNPVTKINVLCPTFTPTATPTSVSYSFSGALNTSITGYQVELLTSGLTLVEDDGIIPVAATISGTFAATLTPLTAYKIRVTVKSSGADKVCLYDITTGDQPPCNAATNLAACICGVDCATACNNV